MSVTIRYSDLYVIPGRMRHVGNKFYGINSVNLELKYNFETRKVHFVLNTYAL